MKKQHFKRALAFAMACVLLCGALTGCQPSGPHGATLTDTARDENGKASVSAPIPLSGFEDIADADGNCTYRFVAEFDDRFTAACNGVTLTVTTPAGESSAADALIFEAKKGDEVTIAVSGAPANEKFAVTLTPEKNAVRLPYEANFTADVSTLDLTGRGITPKATTIEYKKREGGTYVYLNNPEKLQPEDIGQAILRDEGLHGDVQVTWEHSNFTGRNVFLGYQLKNEGQSDVYVTVQNVGYQVSGEWLGQQSWSDYYNMKFDLPADYFEKPGVTAERYVGQDFIDYTPRVYQPMTYRIPAGAYIYVVGGTSPDAHNKTNVAGTANKYVLPGRCTNAVAKMFITGGEVTGTFYCYTDEKQVQAEPEEQGYIIKRGEDIYAWQYKGVDYHTALIESNPVFYVDDDTQGGSLPVTYNVYRDKLAGYRAKKAYDAYQSEKEIYEGYSWVTNINPQGNSRGIGTDMSTFECVTTDGKTVTIDTEHSDGLNGIANLGNWMIDYHDNITLVNQGDRARTFTVNKHAQGALMAYVADRDGNVLKTKCTIVPIEGSSTNEQWEIYEVDVPPHSAVQFTVSFLLMGNSYGNVSHWISVSE